MLSDGVEAGLLVPAGYLQDCLNILMVLLGEGLDEKDFLI
jgi:hypothetical protein